MHIMEQLANEFSLRVSQVESVVKLIDEGNTIPFIARYRKEATGSLDDQVLREVNERLSYLRGLAKRREAIEQSLQEQGVWTDALSAQLSAAKTLAELEDVYRPFKPKRRTRAMIARERGLEPLASLLLLQKPLDAPLEAVAARFIDPEKEVPDAESALQGARDILAETMADDPEVRRRLRALISAEGVLESRQAKEGDSVYRLYYAFSEPVRRIPGHRVLAVNRGEREQWLKAGVRVDDEKALRVLREAFVRNDGPAGAQVWLAAKDAYERLIFPSLERETRADLTERAGTAAVRVFADNLRQLLMQPPIKGKVTLGVDPGFRTGCKLAVVDESGRVLQTGVGHFTIPGQDRLAEQAAQIIRGMVKRHGVTAIAIGNGTASREAERFIASLLPTLPGEVRYVIVSEAGASVYSASKLAAEEFPDFDVSLRSAVSIARRMQDPLAELVKIEPRSIGVGMYQHDLNQTRLTQALERVVEDVVNRVGVDLNTASPALLTHVAGLGPKLARSVVAWRDEHGPFARRKDLLKVSGLGPRSFQQAAGFLRIREGREPLDATAIHPESYEVARAVLERAGISGKSEPLRRAAALEALLAQVPLSRLARELGTGEPTLTDILEQLVRPGRDPRQDLPAPLLRRDVLALEDLQPGMRLHGTVRNVVDFGAFVDLGVKQDGLLHTTRMPRGVTVRPGDVVEVTILRIEAERGRISLGWAGGT